MSVSTCIMESGDAARTMSAASSTTSVASDAKREVFVRRTMASEAGGFAGGGRGRGGGGVVGGLKGDSPSARRLFGARRRGVDSAMVELEVEVDVEVDVDVDVGVVEDRGTRGVETTTEREAQ